jgi:hypothetical protein
MTALRPIYTDNLMHDLKTERFFKPEMVNDMNEVGDGAVKTFPLRGIVASDDGVGTPAGIQSGSLRSPTDRPVSCLF